MPDTPNVLGIIQYGQKKGYLSPDADLKSKREFVRNYAQTKARSPDELNGFMQAAEPVFQQMHLDEIDPTGELRQKRAENIAYRQQAEGDPLATAAQAASDVVTSLATSVSRGIGGAIGTVAPSAGEWFRTEAEKQELVSADPSKTAAGTAGSFGAFAIPHAGIPLMFGHGAATAQEQGIEGLASAGVGALNAGVGYFGGKYLANQAAKLTMPVAEKIAESAASPFLQAYVRRTGQGIAGDVGMGVGAPVGQAAADTLVIGPKAGLEDLASIPEAVAGNLAFGRLFGARGDIAASRERAALTGRTVYNEPIGPEPIQGPISTTEMFGVRIPGRGEVPEPLRPEEQPQTLSEKYPELTAQETAKTYLADIGSIPRTERAMEMSERVSAEEAARRELIESEAKAQEALGQTLSERKASFDEAVARQKAIEEGFRPLENRPSGKGPTVPLPEMPKEAPNAEGLYQDQGYVSGERKALGRGEDVSGKDSQRPAQETGTAQYQVGQGRVKPSQEAAIERAGGRENVSKVEDIDADNYVIHTKHGDKFYVTHNAPMEGTQVGGERGMWEGGRRTSYIRIGKNGDVSVMSHEFGHPGLEILARDKRQLLESRITEVEKQRIRDLYKGENLTDQAILDEAVLARLQKYERHGVLERSTWNKIKDYVTELAQKFGWSKQTERQVFQSMLKGEHWRTPVSERSVRPTINYGERKAISAKDLAKGGKSILKGIKSLIDVSGESVEALRAVGAGDLAHAADKVITRGRDLIQKHMPEYRQALNKTAITLKQTLGGAKKKGYDESIKTVAPEGGNGGVDSAYQKVLNKQADVASLPAGAREVAEGHLQAVKASGDMNISTGGKASYTAPRMYSAEARVLPPEVRTALVDELVAKNPKVDRQQIQNFLDYEIQNASVVSKSPMEFRRLLEYVPQTFYYKGKPYEILRIDPHKAVSQMMEGTAYRAAFREEFGREYNPMVEGGKAGELVKGKFGEKDAAAIQQFERFAKQIHGIHTDTVPFENSVLVQRMLAKPGVEASVNLVKGVTRIAKTGLLTTSATINDAIQGVIGIGATPLKERLVATAKVMGDFSKAKEYAESLGNFVNETINVYDPNSKILTIANQAARVIGAPREAVTKAQIITEAYAGKLWSDRMKGNPGSIGAKDEALLKSVCNFDARTIQKLKDGSAEPSIYDEVVRRVVNYATAHNVARGTTSRLVESRIANTFGPGFVTWADRQFRTRIRYMEQLGEAMGNGDTRAVTGNLMALVGNLAPAAAGAVGTSIAMAYLNGGGDAVKEQLEKSPAEQVKQTFWKTMMGGQMGSVVNAFDRGLERPFLDVAADMSLPLSLGKRFAGTAGKTVRHLQRGEAIDGLMAIPEDTIPSLKMMRNAAGWAVHGTDTYATKAAVNGFYDWARRHPEYVPEKAMMGGKDDPIHTILKDLVTDMREGKPFNGPVIQRLMQEVLKEGGSLKSIKQSLKSRRLMTRLGGAGPDETRDIRKMQAEAALLRDLGPTAYNRIKLYDMLLESMADFF